MTLRSIALTAVIIALGWYWLRAREIKELALQAAARHCETLDLKLLDQTVVLKSISVVRNSRHERCLQRRYQFDFSSRGDDRYQGHLVMHGRTVAQITLAPHRIE